MHTEPIVYALFLFFAGVAVLGTIGSVIRRATVLTFRVSSLHIMLRYPIPIVVSARLRQD